MGFQLSLDDEEEDEDFDFGTSNLGISTTRRMKKMKIFICFQPQELDNE
jgi:hypothetical protein